MPRLLLPPDEVALVSAPPPRLPEKHRGGAWKVAYADFVTALMALFIVLWMMNATEAVKHSVEGYFRDPRGYTRTLGAGAASQGEGLRIDKASVSSVQRRIEDALRSLPNFQKISKNILMSVTGEGLRIDLMESEQGTFFISGSPTPTPAGTRLLSALAAELGRMPNQLVIEGHTDARPFRSQPDGQWDNWDLSTTRANAARRLLEKSGIRAGQIVELRGFSDRRLLNTADPNDPRNRRISVVVRFQEP
ncbi:MAG TPA: flagellar motor protein MotB [Bryobacteraceae bacterium]|nr:flagellar motor protein MotB [Bryobacteraceae bacterium]